MPKLTYRRARLVILTVLMGGAAHADSEGLSKDVIAGVVGKHRNEMKFCYEQALQAKPTLAGKIAINFTITHDGRVGEVNLEEVTLDDATAVACMVSRLKRWRFPNPAGGGQVHVTYPWIFKAATAEADEEPAPVAAPAPNEVEPERPPEPDPTAAQRTAEQFERERERYAQEHPPGLGDLWQQGGFAMYPIALGLLFGLAAGLLAVVLALARSSRTAVIIAGLCLGGGAWAFSTGWLGYVNGMMGAYQAVANVNPADRGLLMRAADTEASVCWKFGTIAAASCAVFGLSAFALALRRKAGPVV